MEQNRIKEVLQVARKRLRSILKDFAREGITPDDAQFLHLQ